MMWLEVIHLRVTRQELDQLNSTFKQLIDQIREKESCRKVQMFRRALIDTDVCLHLYHDYENAEACGSPVGLHIAEALKAFGTVNHTVWMAGSGIESH